VDEIFSDLLHGRSAEAEEDNQNGCLAGPGSGHDPDPGSVEVLDDHGGRDDIYA
jgi:hypothetical protein